MPSATPPAALPSTPPPAKAKRAPVIVGTEPQVRSLISSLAAQLDDAFYDQSKAMIDLFHPNQLRRIRKGKASLKVLMKVANALGFEVVLSLRRKPAAQP